MYRLWLSTVAVYALSNLLPLRTKAHLRLLQVALNASLSRIFSVPTASVRFLHVEFGFPPLQHLCDIALARFNCHLALAAPHTLHSIIHNSRRLRGSDPNPASLEQCTRAALIRLHRPLDYDQFVLPECIIRTATKRPERAYARFLYPTASDTWRAELAALPAIPSRHHSYAHLLS
jgi:hypothetical protein